MAEFVLRHDATRSTLRGGDTLQGASITFVTQSATITQSATTTTARTHVLFSENRPVLRLRSPVGQEANLRAGLLRPYNANPVGGISITALPLFAAIVRQATITQSATLATPLVSTIWYDGPTLLVAHRSYGTLFGTSTPTRTYGDLGTAAPAVTFVECDATITMSAEMQVRHKRVGGHHHRPHHWPTCRPVKFSVHLSGQAILVYTPTSRISPTVAVVLPATPTYWNDDDDMADIIRILTPLEPV